jgi:hypothetical protein
MVEPCTRALDFNLPDKARPIGLPPADDEGIRACPLPGDILAPERSTGESSLIHSDFGPHSESVLPGSSVPDHGGQPITVHEFLQDMTRSKAGRKYGRRNRLGTVTVKLDAYDHGEQCRSPIPPSTSNCHIETQTRNDRHNRRISAYPPRRGRVQSERLSRQVTHLRRKKRFAKSLAQRLFEADVFSSGTRTSSRSTGVTPDQNPTHTSSRRPLQFITSLNLTPSMESRIYGKTQQQPARFGKARTISGSSSGSADSEIQPALVSQADDSVPDSLQDDCSAAVATTSGGKLSSRNWNGAATRKKTRRTRARASPAIMRGSGKRAFRARHGGGKQSSAQVPHNPFEYVPLPLVRVETASGVQRTGATVRKPQSCTGRGRARTQAHARPSNQFQLMSADNHDMPTVRAPRISEI